jgi:Fe-S-cluster-containing hydrogenase component 2
MSLITQLMDVLSAIESDRIAVHEERCISIRNRNAGCLRCAEFCASGAISYQDNALSVDSQLCIGCGTCATACPTSAIEIKDPTDDELITDIKRALVASQGHPVIACEPALQDSEDGSYDVPQVCVLPCLGRIDESVLIGLGAYQAKEVTLLCGTCESCEYGPGGRMVREVIESAQNIFEAFDCSLSVNLATELPERTRMISGNVAPSEGLSRRDFFKSAKQGLSQAAMRAVNQKAPQLLAEGQEVPAAFKKVGRDGTLSRFVPSRRVRVYNYLRHIGEPVADAVETRIVGLLSIDSACCSSCRMCAVFCPTGAIQRVDEGPVFGIMHRPSACMQCRLCEHICPEAAITISSKVPIGQFMGKKARCFAMKKPAWEPNRPSSLYDKVHSVLGDDLEMCSF